MGKDQYCVLSVAAELVQHGALWGSPTSMGPRVCMSHTRSTEGPKTDGAEKNEQHRSLACQSGVAAPQERTFRVSGRWVLTRMVMIDEITDVDRERGPSRRVLGGSGSST